MAMQTREIHMMGTIIQLSVQQTHANFVLDEVIIRLKEYEKRFSANDSNSELMEVNKNAGIMPVKVNPGLYKLIKIGKKHSTQAGSSLNIAIGPLVQAWRIGFQDANVPSQKAIQSLLSRTNASDIILDDQDQTVFLKHTAMFIDLGALAKGFIADLIIHDLQSMNVPAALINLGGNVMTYGISPKHEDGYWRIGIQHPFLQQGNYIAVLRALNQSVVTSGIYERSFTMNNQTYHHILDPNTGYPVKTEIAGLTVVSKESVDGEIWTGRLFGKSPRQIINTLDQLKDVAGIVVTKDGELCYSESLNPYISEAIS
ncbi:thiamine biosynthesis protein ApbE [Virgibacillus profundi]|uniref:FAD:protein FMN transferase n=1 Tax=Virgibacillus profundi TaxID=2024555 RepID=A0A2A2IBD7_9BACI|nr:FAD:protein FMN transferase [Virgibacillus profundi]PAV28440.1 thiamine biosynthesis protein ApbE [Virgibacillus profundi]PXY52613.1 FAD:protein FMN transferase [Virgibacillus profundi]